MTLPDSFYFSKGKLQDYLDCQRRFQLRYLLNLSWPAILAEPIEEIELMVLLGQKFHQMLRQYFLGISQDRITQLINNDKLRIWWNRFLNLQSEKTQMEFIWLEQGQNFPEVSITAFLEKFPAIAKYDLISILHSEKIFIVDWKTSLKLPSHSFLMERMQTKLYPFLLVEAGTFINQGISIDPDAVEMIYWYANFPKLIQRFEYSRQQHQLNERYLKKLIDEISHKQENEFELTTHVYTCRNCTYRSLCERGSHMSNLSHLETFPESYDEIIEPELIIENIAEIEF
jgi:CRISPR/Cas system-associated exonuclease Cas4 (RecB family)